MHDMAFLRDHFQKCCRLLLAADVHHELIRFKNLLVTARQNGKKMILAGNGGSAAIASHCAVDFSKAANVRSVSFSDPSLITCLANDYGYECWLEKALELYAEEGDIVVLISSSGRSANILRAADYARRHGLLVVTFSGFAANNPLRTRGHLNFWVKSRSYNLVEMLHQFWLLSVCDVLVAGKTARSRGQARVVSGTQVVSSSIPPAA